MARVFGKVMMVSGAGLLLYLLVVVVSGTVSAVSGSSAAPARSRAAPAAAELARGRQIFRFDTFGDQAFWGGALQLHRAIAGQKNGGVGPGSRTAWRLRSRRAR